MYFRTFSIIIADSIQFKNTAGFFLLIFILLLVVFIFVVSRIRKKNKEQRTDLLAQLKTSKEEIQKLKTRLKTLEDQLTNGEREWGKWQLEKEKLNQDLLVIKKKLEKKNNKNENKSAKDIIIEYYMKNDPK
jgi:septal ring factor EnvC (AmiA/AmiB activator)